MKHFATILLISLVCFACKQGGSSEYFSTDKSVYWNIEGTVNQSKEEMILTGDDARAITTAAYDDFILEFEAQTAPRAIGALWFHSKGYCGLKTGYEVLINNNRDNADWRKTGSLAAVRNFAKPLAGNDEWFPMRIEVRGQNIRVYVNNRWVVDYTEPSQPFRLPDYSKRRLSSGVFVFANYTDSPIHIRDIKVSDAPGVSTEIASAMDETEDDIIRLHQQNFPLIDSHFHLKDGLTVDDVEALTRRYGITYGIAPNCGLNFPITADKQIDEWLDEMKGHLFFLPMQAEGREWLDLFSMEYIRKFDYVFSDALTWADNKGRRTRIWIPEETYVDDEQVFMNTLVDRACTIIRTEPIDIFVNPTFLPDELMGRYDTLWTSDRTDRVIDACLEAGVAIEINNRYRIPSQAFILRAKEKGIKFTLGTNNGFLEDIDQMAYGIRMVEACGLTIENMYIPESKNP